MPIFPSPPFSLLFGRVRRSRIFLFLSFPKRVLPCVESLKETNKKQKAINKEENYGSTALFSAVNSDLLSCP